MWARCPVSTGPRGKLGTVLITGFPAGVLQCNCYVLAERPGMDCVIVDPGQRAMGPLRRILDQNRLTYLHAGRYKKLTDIGGRVIREVIA